MKWFDIYWYQYIFNFKELQGLTFKEKIRMLWCRIRGHSRPIWYTTNFEPDMHCSNCGEDLG